MVAEVPQGRAAARDQEAHSSRLPAAAPPWTFVEPEARAQMEATYHLWKHIKVVNQVNKLLTKIQLQMDKIEKICVSYGFIW